jgi:hypothetical protein
MRNGSKGALALDQTLSIKLIVDDITLSLISVSFKTVVDMNFRSQV